MADSLLIQQLKEALADRRAQPPEERWADLVRRGVIDERGRVLKRAPEAPKPPAKRKSTAGR
jgi:hypothetical protein